MMTRSTFSHDVNRSELAYLRAEGLNNKQIALRVGASPATVGKYLPSVRKERVKLTEHDRDEMFELWRDGDTVADIAKSYGCAKTVVYRLLKARGIELRGRREKPQQTVEKAEEVVTAQQAVEPSGSRGDLVKREMGIYTGWLGEYIVDYGEETVILPRVPERMNKETLRRYTRDLMAVYAEAMK